MKQSKLLFFLFITATFFACHSGENKSYAIRDFRKALQPELTRAVTKGVVSYLDTSLLNVITDNELMDLSKSEHPILRALAFRAMLYKPSFNHFDIIMNNLSDTAFITTDMGEFGLGYSLVSDDILESARWKDTTSKNKTIDVVLTKHNYLRSAYKILLYIEPQEKFYSYIKQMAERQVIFDDKEYALYGLAKFKRHGDLELISRNLLSNYRNLTNISFRLMEECQNEVYMDVFRKYYKRHFAPPSYYNDSYLYTHYFFHSLASYKTEESAKLLDTILNNNPFLSIGGEGDYLKEDLIMAIWENKCPVYSKLIERVRDSIKKYESSRGEVLPVDPAELLPQFKKEPIQWLSR